MVVDGVNGWTGYLDYEMGFGLMQQTLSQQIYAVSYGTSSKGVSEVNRLGIAGRSGYDGAGRMHLEFGPAYIFKVGGNRSAVNLGFFWNYSLPIFSAIFPINNTSTEYSWGLGGRMVYGVNGGVAFTF